MTRPLTRQEFYALNDAIRAWAEENNYPVTDESLDEAVWAAIGQLSAQKPLS